MESTQGARSDDHQNRQRINEASAFPKKWNGMTKFEQNRNLTNVVKEKLNNTFRDENGEFIVADRLNAAAAHLVDCI